MYIDDAVASHLQVKSEVYGYLRGDQLSKPPDVLCRYDMCKLGLAIAEYLPQYEHNSNFKKLKKHHEEFHNAVCVIIKFVALGDIKTAKAVYFSLLTKASINVVTSILKFESSLPIEET